MRYRESGTNLVRLRLILVRIGMRVGTARPIGPNMRSRSEPNGEQDLMLARRFLNLDDSLRWSLRPVPPPRAPFVLDYSCRWCHYGPRVEKFS